MIRKTNYFLVLLITIFLLTSCESGELTSENYNSVVQRLGWYEAQNPTLFLDASGRYNENFWGDKFQITAEINNKAKVASYKDIKIRVTYYSKTQTVMTSNDYVVYEIASPQRITKVKMKIDNYQNVDAIGWEVIDASINSWN